VQLNAKCKSATASAIRIRSLLTSDIFRIAPTGEVAAWISLSLSLHFQLLWEVVVVERLTDRVIAIGGDPLSFLAQF